MPSSGVREITRRAKATSLPYFACGGPGHGRWCSSDTTPTTLCLRCRRVVLGTRSKTSSKGSPELLISKRVNSSFYGTPDLDAWLRYEGIDQVVICGITTNHCCETTARMAGNLGYDTYFVIDATHTFDRVGLDGTTVPAATLSAITATNLHGEFATVVTTDELQRHIDS